MMREILLMSAKEFMKRWVVPEEHDYVIVRDDGRPTGLPAAHRLGLVPKDDWRTRFVRALVRSRFQRAYPDKPLDDVLERMVERSMFVIPAVDSSRGVLWDAVSSRDILAQLSERH